MREISEFSDSEAALRSDLIVEIGKISFFRFRKPFRIWTGPGLFFENCKRYSKLPFLFNVHLSY